MILLLKINCFAFLCIAWANITSGELFDHQPVLADKFELVLIKAHENSVKNNLINCFKTLIRGIRDVFDHCIGEQDKSFGDRIWNPRNKLFSRLCGTVSSLGSNVRIIEWIIQKMQPSVGIRINILRMNLPFLGFDCKFANITFSSLANKHFCGRNSGLVVFSESTLYVRLSQGFLFYEDSGFVAAFRASQYEESLYQEERKILYVPADVPNYVPTSRQTAEIRYVPFYEQYESSKRYSWQIISRPYTKITLICTNMADCTVHDGAWPRSPKLESKREITMTGYLAYIEQSTSELAVEYSIVENKEHHNITDISVSSSRGSENTMFVTSVPAQHNAIKIHLIDVTYADSFDHFKDKCHFGGLFIYSFNDKSTQWKRVAEFCDTLIKDEFTIYLQPSDLQYFVYVSFYAGSSQGRIKATLHNEQCNNLDSTVYLTSRCNYIIKELLPDKESYYHVKTPKGAGPFVVGVHTRPLIYTRQPNNISVIYIDRNAFNRNSKLNSQILHGDSTLELNNPRALKVYHEPRLDSFASRALLIVTLDVRSLCASNDPVGVQRLSHAAIFLQLRASCSVSFVGSLLYKFDFIATADHRPNKINLWYEAKHSCAERCTKIHVNTTEYQPKLKRYIKTYYPDQAMPFMWENVYTLFTAQMIITQENLWCLECILSVSIGYKKLDWESETLDKIADHIYQVDNFTSK